MSDARRQRLFFAITVATPFVLLLLLEGALRLFWEGGRLPLFVRAPIASGEYLVANRDVGRRWFAAEQTPPAAMPEPFLQRKPANGYRVFVLGESSTAGFPYPRNVTFSRLLRDALRDGRPGDTVEVINLGIAATNSYAMLDLAGDVIAQRPDAVLIYAGHNEWYGALGVGSTETLSLPPSLVRFTLRLQRLRTVLALRQGIAWARSRIAGDRVPLESASLMESLARDKEITLGSDAFARGVRQFGENLGAIADEFRDAGIPVFIGSPVSNLRDQKPFASPVNAAPGGADGIFAEGAAALAAGDTARAREAFTHARDMDVVRFRAPTAFDSVTRAVAARHGATFVPVGEAFARAAPSGIPGRELFLEHVHPNPRGHSVIAQAFFEALRAAPPRPVRADSVKAWEEYERERWLSELDTLVAEHARRTLLVRWPFVSADSQRDYRATYRPTDLVDSMAFVVSRGAPWEAAKLRLAEHFEQSGALDAAILEYRGLARDAPYFETPHRLLARALARSGDIAGAEVEFRRALAIQPTAMAAHALALMSLRQRRVPEGIRLLEMVVRMEPGNADAWFQLALAQGQAQNVPAARAAAQRVAQIAPRHPGLPGLLRALGLSR